MKLPLKHTSLPALLLRELLLLGAVLYSSRNPYVMARFLGTEGSAGRQREFDRINRSLRKLRKEGYVDYSPYKNTGTLKITKKGKTLAEQLAIASMKLPVAKRWDGLWRVVVFDIPNTKHNNRLAFQSHIKSLGFKMVQKSVWAYPYECQKEIETLKEFYEIENYVAYMEVARIEGALGLQSKFHFK